MLKVGGINGNLWTWRIGRKKKRSNVAPLFLLFGAGQCCRLVLYVMATLGENRIPELSVAPPVRHPVISCSAFIVINIGHIPGIGCCCSNIIKCPAEEVVHGREAGQKSGLIK